MFHCFVITALIFAEPGSSSKLELRNAGAVALQHCPLSRCESGSHLIHVLPLSADCVEVALASPSPWHLEIPNRNETKGAISQL